MTQSTQDQKALRVLHFKAQDVLRLARVEFDPDRNVVIVAGDNGHGKTSLLECLRFALGGKRALPDKPVRDGADHGEIELDLGDFIVHRTLLPDRRERLQIRTRQGLKFSSPQQMLDKMLEGISFDPGQFLRMKPKEQADELLRIVDLGLDVGGNRLEYDKAYGSRTETGRDVKRLQAALASLPAEAEPKCRAVDLIMDDLKGLQGRRQAQEIARAKLRRAEGQIAELPKRLAQAREVVKKLEDAERAWNGELARRKAEVAALVPIDTIALETELKAATQAGEVRARLRARKDQEAMLVATKASYDGLTKTLEELDRELASALRAADFPVKGLGVDASGVVFRERPDGPEIPFPQCSSALQLRVAFLVAIRTAQRAGNPLRVVRILDGSFLDRANLAVIEELAQEHDVQVWIERVDRDGASIIVEDGQLADADRPAATASAAPLLPGVEEPPRSNELTEALEDGTDEPADGVGDFEPLELP